MARLDSLLRWLPQQAKSFRVPGKNVEVIFSPTSYFETIKTGILKAQHRVIVSSLYLGTGSREKEIIRCFNESLSDKSKKELKCTFLVDHLRGSRGRLNSRTMARSLIKRYYDRFTFGLYHTPNLRGYLKDYGPERFNEVMGLQHMKIFVSDEDVLISGANLSEDYFVNRQDRYILFKNCKELADFFSDLVNTVTDHSFTLGPYGSTRNPAALTYDPLLSRKNARNFETALNQEFRELMEPVDTTPPSLDNNLDTVVFPLLQAGFCGIRQDETVTKTLLEELDSEDALYLASGYFNLPPEYTRAILKSRGSFNILAAAPQANGFYKAEGVAGHIPAMYVYFANQFLKQVRKTRSIDRIKYLEYDRPDWTFHGKGSWCYLAGETHPSLTVIGSSNNGCRSLTRDLEAQVCMVTSNSELKAKLHEERVRMFDHATEVKPRHFRRNSNRSVTLFARIASPFLKPHV